MSDFFKGAFCVFRGIACFYKDRSLWKYALKAWGIILIVYIAVLRLIFYLAGVLANYWNARLADYPVFLQKLLFVLCHNGIECRLLAASTVCS